MMQRTDRKTVPNSSLGQNGCHAFQHRPLPAKIMITLCGAVSQSYATLVSGMFYFLFSRMNYLWRTRRKLSAHGLDRQPHQGNIAQHIQYITAIWINDNEEIISLVATCANWHLSRLRCWEKGASSGKLIVRDITHIASRILH